MAHAGLALLAGTCLPLAAPETSLSIEGAMAHAAMIVADGDVTGAARLVYDALAGAASPNAGWLVPIDPLLDVERDRDAWAQVLALLRTP